MIVEFSVVDTKDFTGKAYTETCTVHECHHV